MPKTKVEEKATTEDEQRYVNIRGLSMYAKLREPTPPKEVKKGPQLILIPPRWEVEVLVTQAEANRLAGLGLEVKGLIAKDVNPKHLALIEEMGLSDKGYAGAYVVVRKKTEKKKWDSANGRAVLDAKGLPVTEPAAPVKIYDSVRNEITDPDFLIGNGSEITARAQISAVGTAKLMSVTIHEYVPYIKASKAGSFVYDASANSEDDSVSFDVSEDDDYEV